MQAARLTHTRRSRKSPVAGVILAAGCGRRMSAHMGGRPDLPKQLLPFRSAPLLGHVIDQARSSMLAPICLVLGHRAAEIRTQVERSRVEVVVNANYEAGQASSLIAGLNTVADRCAAAMFLLGDQPLVSAALMDRLIKAYGRKGASITLPSFEGRRGNPVIIAASLFTQLRRLSGDTGARALFQAHADEIERVPVEDPTVLMDVDTPGDYDRLLKRRAN